MNKNFQHKNIATLGGEQLQSFIELLEHMGWKGADGWDGSGEDCYYTINPLGILEFDVPEEHFTIVCATDFIHYYSDMLAPTPGDERDIISISRSEFKKIYDVACTSWKDKLSTWAGEHMFKDKLEFTHEQIKLMLEASTQAQFPIVREVFHEYKYDKTIDLSNMELTGEVFDSQGSHAMIAINIMDYKSFYLNNEYDWNLFTNKAGITYLIPTKK